MVDVGEQVAARAELGDYKIIVTIFIYLEYF